MVSAAMVVRDMLNTLEEEDCKEISEEEKNRIQDMINGLVERAKKASDLMDEFQSVIGEDKGWDSEEAMLEDMSRFRKERMGL